MAKVLLAKQYRDGNRKGVRAAVMIAMSKVLSDAEVKAAADYFASLKPAAGFNKVIETDTVAKSFVGAGGMRFATPDGGREPIGNRIIVLPQDEEKAKLRDPRSGFIDYVPTGNPNNRNAEARAEGLQAAARAIGQQIHIFNANSETEIDKAFAALVRLRISAILVGDDPFFESQRIRLIALAARNAIPAIYDTRDYPAAGGMMSYGASFSNAYRQAGIYIGRILKGAKPADLPVMQPTTFELVINVNAAKALGLSVPMTLLAIADEVIE